MGAPKSLWLLLATALLSGGCNSTSPGRAERDASIGFLETDRYRLTVADGLAHVRGSSSEAVELRASAAELSLTVERLDPTLTELSLRMWNVPPGFALQSEPGVLGPRASPSAGEPDEAQPLGARWTVRFPAGMDEVTLRTPPRPDEPFTFLAFGDIQNGIDRFGDVIQRVNQEEDAEFILMLGDLSMRAREEEFDRVEEAYAQIRHPIYATPGNHDVDETLRYQRRFGRASYTFEHRGMRFSSIDSGSADIAPATLEDFRGWAEQGQDQLHAVFSHIPAIDRFGIRSGQWNARRQALSFLSAAADHQTDLLLFGHIHSFDEYSLGGIPTYISGGCGAFEEKLDGIDRHYLRIRADPLLQTLEVTVVRVD